MTRLPVVPLVRAATCLALVLSVASCKPSQGASQSQAPPQQQRSAGTAQPQDGLHTIESPGGGEVVYGTLTGQSSLSNAMVYMLRQVHGHFGDQPKIGKFFQSKGGDSVATFFTLTAKTQGNKPIAGLVIVNMPSGTTPTAAVLYDDPSRFAKTEPAMMQQLNAALQHATPSAAATSVSQPAPQPAPQTLRTSTAGDRSASIGLAPGWQITGVSGGQLIAQGPNGEQISIAIMYQGIQNSGNGMAFGGHRALVCPYGGNVFQAYTCVIDQLRQSKNLPAPTFKLISSQKLATSQYEQQVIQAIFELDLHDGKGMRKASARIGEMHVGSAPTWVLTLSGSNAPETVFDAQNPTIMAMVHSYSANRSVINQETQAVINNIHAISAASTAQAHAADARREASSAAFGAHMDSIDQQSKAFQNYTLDRSVVQDMGSSERGTVSNSYADSLVKADPNRFQIVANQNLIKGQDY